MNTKLQSRLVKQYMELAKEKGFQERLADGTQAMPQHSALDRIEKLDWTIHGQNIIDHDLRWQYCEPGVATVKYLGKVIKHKVPADIVLVGTVETLNKTYCFSANFQTQARYKLTVTKGVPS